MLIRDKIAASKAKGMWMGGIVPLGYNLPAPGTRKLLVNPEEAELVRRIFVRYLELRSVHRLADELATQGVTSKRRITATGKQLGGQQIGRGALFDLLRNQVYLGKITHKGAVHEGEHEAIVDPALFAEVQAVLESRPGRRTGAERATHPAILTGKIFDVAGKRMTPAFSRGRGGRIYRYYVSASLQRGTAASGDGGQIKRIAAPLLDGVIIDLLGRLMPGAKASLSLVKKVQLDAGVVAVELAVPLAKLVRANLADGEDVVPTGTGCSLTIPLASSTRGGRGSIVAGAKNRQAPDPILVRALRKSHRLLSRDSGGLPTMAAAPKSPYERSLVRLALLAPDIQQAILSGRHPRQLNLETLLSQTFPLDWAAQRRVLGFSG